MVDEKEDGSGGRSSGRMFFEAYLALCARDTMTNAVDLGEHNTAAQSALVDESNLRIILGTTR